METILSWVRAVLATTPARWSNLVGTLPVELLLEAPAPGEWSAMGCLQHLVDTEQWVFPVRVRALLAGQESFPPFDPDSQGTLLAQDQPPTGLAQTFARMRAGNLDLLARITPEDLGRRSRHLELGMVTLNELLHEWAAHDLMHTVQAERALMQPFIRASGPWEPYFRDHIASR